MTGQSTPRVMGGPIISIETNIHEVCNRCKWSCAWVWSPGGGRWQHIGTGLTSVDADFRDMLRDDPHDPEVDWFPVDPPTLTAR